MRYLSWSSRASRLFPLLKILVLSFQMKGLPLYKLFPTSPAWNLTHTASRPWCPASSRTANRRNTKVPASSRRVSAPSATCWSAALTPTLSPATFARWRPTCAAANRKCPVPHLANSFASSVSAHRNSSQPARWTFWSAFYSRTVHESSIRPSSAPMSSSTTRWLMDASTRWTWNWWRPSLTALFDSTARTERARLPFYAGLSRWPMRATPNRPPQRSLWRAVKRWPNWPMWCGRWRNPNWIRE